MESILPTEDLLQDCLRREPSLGIHIMLGYFAAMVMDIILHGCQEIIGTNYVVSLSDTFPLTREERAGVHFRTGASAVKCVPIRGRRGCLGFLGPSAQKGNSYQ